MGVYISLPVLELTILRYIGFPQAHRDLCAGSKGVFQHPTVVQFPVEKRMKLPL